MIKANFKTDNPLFKPFEGEVLVIETYNHEHYMCKAHDIMFVARRDELDFSNDDLWRLTKRVLVCAALKKGDRIITGARHGDKIMRNQINASEGVAFWRKGAEQGFVDQMGDFYNREDAWIIAEAAGQIINRDSGPAGILFSENLY